MNIFLLILICFIFGHSDAKEVKATSISRIPLGDNAEEVNLLLRVENWFLQPASAMIEFAAGESAFGRDFNWHFLIVHMYEIQMYNIKETNEEEYPGRYIESTVTLLDCDGNPVKDYPAGILHEEILLAGSFDELVDANVCEFTYVRFSANFRIYNNASYVHATKGLISNEPHVQSTTLSWDNPITILEKVSTGKELWGKDATWQFSMKEDHYFEMKCLGTTFSPAYGGGGFKVWTLETEDPEYWYLDFPLSPYELGTSQIWNLTIALQYRTVTKVELMWDAFGEAAIMADYIPTKYQ